MLRRKVSNTLTAPPGSDYGGKSLPVRALAVDGGPGWIGPSGQERGPSANAPGPSEQDHEKGLLALAALLATLATGA